MSRFYVNSNMYDGHHEVHRTFSDCPRHAEPRNRVDLGEYHLCSSAIARANELGYRPADGCYFCVEDCHTR